MCDAGVFAVVVTFFLFLVHQARNKGDRLLPPN